MLVKEIQNLCIIKTALAQTAHLRVCVKKKGGGGCAVNLPMNKNHLFYLDFYILYYHLALKCFVNLNSQSTSLRRRKHIDRALK